MLASPGPASGTRTDVLWCDVQPDEGTWSLRIIPEPQTAGQPGMPLARLAVPAGANLASQMTITADDSLLERRMLSIIVQRFTPGHYFWAESWSMAGDHGQGAESGAVWMVPGQYYRVRYTLAAVDAINRSLDHRVAVGHRVWGQPPSASIIGRQAVVTHFDYRRPQAVDIEWVFRWPRTDPLVQWQFDARYWSDGPGEYQLYADTAPVTDPACLTVEDVGS